MIMTTTLLILIVLIELFKLGASAKARKYFDKKMAETYSTAYEVRNTIRVVRYDQYTVLDTLRIMSKDDWELVTVQRAKNKNVMLFFTKKKIKNFREEL